MSQAQPKSWSVVKFGGTSVSSVDRWQVIAGLLAAPEAAGLHTALVCSAVAGVTDQLDRFIKADSPAVRSQIARQLLETHRHLAAAMEVTAQDELGHLARELDSSLAGELDFSDQARLMALGEWISSKLGCLYLQSQGLDAVWQDAQTALHCNPDDHPQRAWLEAECLATADQVLQRRWAASRIVVTQGFVGSNDTGQTVLLGRGGSDTSAVCLGAVLAAARVEIYTDVDGVFSADPYQVPEARLLHHLEYEEALEMAGAGAMVIHPRAIRAAQRAGIIVSVRRAKAKPGPGTEIGAPLVDSGFSFKAVTCRKGMAAILLENQDIRRSIGFLAWVFDVFTSHGISIDQVATSETTTTVLLDRQLNRLGSDELETLLGRLRERCQVTPFDSCACVCVVGHGVSQVLGSLGPALQILEQSPLYLASLSANDLAYSMVVPDQYADQLTAALHQVVVPAMALSK